MNCRLNSPEPDLCGPEGKLVFVRVSVPSRSLEQLLETLAQATFPVNPEIRHGQPLSAVEFPGYEGNVEEVKTLLRSAGLQEAQLVVERALEAIR